ncbi:hypothetical protein [Sporosarcina sp. BP05]|uniref:hypothetical protein n=1 Tax=Sporosarcina sp. BP05 TaxID=2758726 RepID=UPI0016448894
MNRFGDSEELNEIVVCLASSWALSFVTGVLVRIDAGFEKNEELSDVMNKGTSYLTLRLSRKALEKNPKLFYINRFFLLNKINKENPPSFERLLK